MAGPNSPSEPSFPWQLGSSVVIGFIGSLSRLFLFGANHTEVHGLDGFLELLDKRRDLQARTRGLITGKFALLSLALFDKILTG